LDFVQEGNIYKDVLERFPVERERFLKQMEEETERVSEKSSEMIKYFESLSSRPN
jgi:hypothetical protein